MDTDADLELFGIEEFLPGAGMIQIGFNNEGTKEPSFSVSFVTWSLWDLKRARVKTARVIHR
jgi:hypothetical protein